MELHAGLPFALPDFPLVFELIAPMSLFFTFGGRVFIYSVLTHFGNNYLVFDNRSSQL